MALTPKQKMFVQEYLVDLNATQAAIRAGYSSKTAYSMGQRLLKNVEIQAAIQEAKTNRQERTEITQDKVLKEIARLAFFDVRKLFDEDGKPLAVSELDDDTASAIAGLDVQEQYETISGEKIFVGYVKKYKLADKLKALELAGKHVGAFEKPERSIPGAETSDDDLSKSLKELAEGINHDELA